MFRDHVVPSLIGIFILTRIALVVVGVLSITYLPSNYGTEYRHLNAIPELDMWYRWDAGFYTSIALYGYDWEVNHRPSADLAFFPLYPMLIRAVDQWLGDPTAIGATISGLLISNIALILAVPLFYDLAKNFTDRVVAQRSVLLMLLSPISVFFSGVYTESLFLFMTLLVFHSLMRGRFLVAVLAASLACLTRSTGIALYLPLLLYAWRSELPNRVITFFLAQIPIGVFLGYLIVVGLMLGNIFSYFNANQLFWGRSFSSPFVTFSSYFGGDPVVFWGWKLSWIDLGSTILFLILTAFLLRYILPIGLFSIIAVTIPIMTGTLTSMPRYGFVVFPFYLIIARWITHPWQKLAVYGLFMIVNLLFVARFVTWHLIA